jgi:hypothetical protein
MKIGETFIDGNRKFEVVGFASGYPVSQFIGLADEPVKEEFTAEPVKAEPVKEEITKPNYEDMQYAQLKKLCAEKGLSAKGSKQDLVDRLRG